MTLHQLCITSSGYDTLRALDAATPNKAIYPVFQSIAQTMHKIVIEPFEFQQSDCLQSWFASIQHLPGSVLLHSGDSNHENARFHIAAAHPILTITLESDGLVSHSIGEDIQDQQLLDSLEEVLGGQTFGHQIIELAQKVQGLLFGAHKIPDTQLPFLCGGIGYSGYDFGRFLEKLPEKAKDEYKTSLFSLCFYSWSLITDCLSQKTWLCYSNFFGKPDVSRQQRDSKNSSFSLNTPWQSNMSQAEYIQKLDAIYDYLLAGDCYQVNLAQRFSAEYEGDDWVAWLALHKANQAPFSAFIRNENSCIISVSPERFIASHNGHMETKPIKGTRPRFNDPIADQASREELYHSEKDRAENLMIVDLLRNDLSKNALPHSVKVEKLFEIESFQAVHHLVSTVQANLKPGVSPLALMKDAFPGGSITGAPKVRAMEVIDELEPHRRNIYCGSIFYLGINDDFDSNICIRTLLLENNKIYCWAGGGIVADSQAQLEYEETFHKVNKILPILEGLS